MVTENQLDLNKLMNVVLARQNVQNADKILGTLRHALDEVKLSMMDAEVIDAEAKNKFAEIDLRLYEISRFLSYQDDVLHSNKFQVENRLFKVLGDGE